MKAVAFYILFILTTSKKGLNSTHVIWGVGVPVFYVPPFLQNDQNIWGPHVSQFKKKLYRPQWP